MISPWGLRFRKSVVLLAFFLWGSAPQYSSALTLSQLRTEIRVRIKDVGTASTRQRFTDTQILNILNQSQRDAVNFTPILHKQTSTTLVAQTTYYSLPSDYMYMDRVTYKNQNIPEQTLAALDSKANYAAWETQSGVPNSYFLDPSQPTMIGIYPYPTTSSTGTIKMMYGAQATDLVSDSDLPYNGIGFYNNYQDILIYDACYKIFLIEGEMAKAQEYKYLYETRVKQINELLGESPNYVPGFSGPNPR